MRVGLAQVRPMLGKLNENIAMHQEMIQRAKAENVDLLVFPELSLTGYHLLDITYDVARNVESEEIQQLVRLAEGIDIAFGFVESGADHRIFNSALYAAEGQVQHVHRKIYLPTYGMFDEARYFGQGDTIRSFSTRFGQVGMLICEDMWHPSTTYLLAQDGAQILLGLVNSPSRGVHATGLGNQESWHAIIESQSQFYGMVTCFSQRVGVEDGLIFSGGSTVADPFGEIAPAAPMFEEALHIIDVDLDQIRRARYQMPLLRDENLDLTVRELKRIIRQRTGGNA
ncbi:nitrilase-related carbon-nitrogen hydrolase [Risungbinella massiliensis]|uniref:nitrilase-related carbon-nitrogen hydrolase n=1 Tax=Risungbinella massiliensis TaxID=1329796 RepID=UPI0005CBDA47|nr:nitrilase-related carbon-nitrogen hydrolase [Risungbinella massiliensis]